MSYVLDKSDMRRVTLAELEAIAAEYREALQEAADDYGRDIKVYLHWSAGHYGQFWDDYHVQIDGDGAIYVIGDGELDDTLSATWKRNSGSVSVCLLGCVDAEADDLGDEPPTDAQIEGMAQAVAALCNGLWLTIDKRHVMTHGEAADNEDGVHEHEPYGPKHGCERWDLEYLGTEESPEYNPYATDGSRGGDVLRGKANWYRQYWQEQGGTPDD